MTRNLSLPAFLIAILLCFSGISAGQAWSGVLTSPRAIDWSNAGATITNRTTQCGSTVAPYTGTAATINTAIANCAAGQYVQLGAGKFTLSTSIVNTTASKVTLRGMGPDQTFIVWCATSSNCTGLGGVAFCVFNGENNAYV